MSKYIWIGPHGYNADLNREMGVGSLLESGIDCSQEVINKLTNSGLIELFEIEQPLPEEDL